MGTQLRRRVRFAYLQSRGRAFTHLTASVKIPRVRSATENPRAFSTCGALHAIPIGCWRFLRAIYDRCPLAADGKETNDEK